MSERSEIWRAIGPGVLFAGTAVGVSHLVQSTRAGASYGMALVVLVVLANVVKYPAFRFGPMYAAATGTSLLEGYRRRGRWALVLYALVTLVTMFTVQAAVTLVTAGLSMALFGIEASPLLVSGVILGVCAALVGTGGYRVLDRAVKVIVAFLAISTLLATALVIPRIAWAGESFWPSGLTGADALFAAALVGWMPSAIDVSIWQSVWTLARGKETGGRPQARASSIDFHLGYVGTAILAICFVVLGAALLHREGLEIEASPAAFAAQLISLYVEALGEWSRPVIGTAAFATMFSTTLTVVDGFPRALSVLVDRFEREEVPDDPGRNDRTPTYWISLGVIFIGSMAILAFFLGSFRLLIDVATVSSFLTAPVLSWLNHRAMTGAEVPEEARPRPWLVVGSLAGIAAQAAFAIYFVFLQFSES